MLFNILGSLEVVHDTRSLDLGRPLQRTLLAVLLLDANRVVPVDRLVSDMWGDDPPKRPLAAIQVYVSRLRAALEPRRGSRMPGEVLIRQAPGYLLRVARGELDADRFDALVRDGQRRLAEGDPVRASHTLARALQLWRGPALAEFADTGFARPVANRLEESRRLATEWRLDAELAAGHSAAAAAELEGLVSTDPLRERWWELLALALYRSDRQGEALRALARARQALIEALGIEPGADLRNLERAILAQSPELSLRPPRRVRGSTTSPTASNARLVGRQDELHCLWSALQQANTGQGGIVVVSGEAGIGKSRVVEELAGRSIAAEIPTVVGVCHDGESAPPYWPWVQIVRGLVSDCDFDAVRAALRSGGGAIAGMVPDVLETALGERSDSFVLALDGDGREIQFNEAVLGFLGRLTGSQPVVIVLEDAQWADAASLELAHLVISQLNGLPILLVVTHRDVDLGANHPLFNLLAAASRSAHTHFLSLTGLSLTEVGELLENGMGRKPGDSLTSLIFNRSDGNPFFVSELLRFLNGQSADEREIELVVPHRVRAMVHHQLGRLDEQTTKMLAFASVIGREFNFALLAQSGGCDEEALLSAIDNALVAGLIVELPTVGHYRFAHSMVRDAIYDGLNGMRRRRAHARIAEAIEIAAEPISEQIIHLPYQNYGAAPSTARLAGPSDLASASGAGASRKTSHAT